MSRINELPEMDFVITHVVFGENSGVTGPQSVQLTNLSRLESLVFARNSGMNKNVVDTIVKLKPLKTLLFYGVTISGNDVKRLVQSHPELQNIVIGVDQQGVTALLALKQLQRLWVWMPESAENTKTIARMSQLQNLSITHRQSEAGFSELATLKNLTTLHLHDTPLSDSTLQELTSLDKLEYLSVGSTKLSDASLIDISKFERLEALYVQNTVITDTRLPHLDNLKQLRHIDLSETKVTAAGVEKLHNALPQCEIIWDGGTISPVAYIWPKDQPAPAIAPFNAEQAKQHQEDWAKRLGVEVETTNSIGMKFRVIPPGEFLMGSSEEEIAKLVEEAAAQKSNTNGPQLSDREARLIRREGPQHKIFLTTPFAAGIHEVTRGQFRQFIAATGYKTDAEKDVKGGKGFRDGVRVESPSFLWNTNIGFDKEQTDDHPVVNASWNDAVAFCKWLSKQEDVTYRLPSEAEWEFACRAGSSARYCFGNDELLLKEYARYLGELPTYSIGSKKANIFGLFDLHGNVWEFCHDWNDEYAAASAVDPTGPSQGKTRILRGGGLSLSPRFQRSANRFAVRPSERFYKYGFRIIRTFEKPKRKTTHFSPKDQPAPAIAVKPEAPSALPNDE